METTWLKHYPPGIPAEVNVDEFDSLVDVLERSCARFAEQPAYCNMGVQMSFVELDRHSRDFAAYHQNATPLNRGDRVALMMPNLLQFPVAMFGVLRAGMVVVNVNPQYTAPELEHQLRDSGASAIVVRSDPTLTERALIDYCRQYLTDYKVPRWVEFRNEPLPKTNLGKTLRRQLRDADASRQVPP